MNVFSGTHCGPCGEFSGRKWSGCRTAHQDDHSPAPASGEQMGVSPVLGKFPELCVLVVCNLIPFSVDKKGFLKHFDLGSNSSIG